MSEYVGKREAIIKFIIMNWLTSGKSREEIRDGIYDDLMSAGYSWIWNTRPTPKVLTDGEASRLLEAIKKRGFDELTQPWIIDYLQRKGGVK